MLTHKGQQFRNSCFSNANGEGGKVVCVHSNHISGCGVVPNPKIQARHTERPACTEN